MYLSRGRTKAHEFLENLVSSYGMEWILRDPLSVYVNSSKFVFGMDCVINTVIPSEKNKNWLEMLEAIWTRFLEIEMSHVRSI